MDGGGNTYYINGITGESTWDQPADFTPQLPGEVREGGAGQGRKAIPGSLSVCLVG